MNTNETPELAGKFGAMDARIQVVHQPIPWRLRQGTSLQLDVRHDRKGEFFELRLFDQSPPVDVLDLRPNIHHLLLGIREHGQVAGSVSPVRAKLLCGHDERHWFVVGVPIRSWNVENAIQRLKPGLVREQVTRRRVRFSERHKRHTSACVRQGEWFFVPAPDLIADPAAINRPEELRRGRRKPHIAVEGCRRGGTNVYVCRQHPGGLTAAQYCSLLASNQKARYFKMFFVSALSDRNQKTTGITSTCAFQLKHIALIAMMPSVKGAH